MVIARSAKMIALNRVYSVSQNDRNDLVLFIKFNSIFVRIFSFLNHFMLQNACFSSPNAVKNTFYSWDFLEKDLPGSEFIFLISGSIICGKLSFEYIHEVFEIIND